MKISKWSYLLFASFTLLISCNTKNESTSENDKAHGTRIDSLMSLYNNNQYEEFVNLAEKDLDLMDKWLVPLAAAYGELGDFESGFYVARVQLTNEPKDYHAMLVIGNFHLTLENYDSAEIYYNRVIELRPTYSRAYVNLGTTYEIQGKKQDAINNYIEAAELCDFNNKKEDVAKLSNRVLELDPTNKQAKNFLERLHIKAPKEK